MKKEQNKKRREENKNMNTDDDTENESITEDTVETDMEEEMIEDREEEVEEERNDDRNALVKLWKKLSPPTPENVVLRWYGVNYTISAKKLMIKSYGNRNRLLETKSWLWNNI